MKLYIAGPMTGFENYNYPAFHDAADQLRGLGYEVLNPADTESEHPDDPSERTWVWYMRHALAKLVMADGLALLDGWEASRGAQLETTLAPELKIKVRTLDEWIASATFHLFPEIPLKP